ncbi:MAG: alanine racemase [Lachnospiraceae bacterium]|nr:alanine racemase [Lachnospiraceae bacterium]
MRSWNRTAAVVDLAAIEENYHALSDRIPSSVRRCLVVKTDGYGHGAIPIVRRLQKEADFLAVAAAEEAFELRDAGITLPVLILGYTWPQDYEALIRQEVRIPIFSEEDAKELSETAVRLGREALVHIKVDTGMHRIGFPVNEEAVNTVRQIRRMPGICVEGIFTHFARADETDKRQTLEQAEAFRWFIRSVEDGEEPIAIHHCANSAATMEMQEEWMDMVRIGISLYGIYPSDEVAQEIPLTQALTWKSEIVLIKDVPAGAGISYGYMYVADSDRRVATIPVGYGDGYPRQLSDKGYVMIHGKKAPILGRVCMDQMMVDVTDIPEAQRGDTVLLTGHDENGTILVEILSDLSGRFPYEFMCDIGKRVPRIYVG